MKRSVLIAIALMFGLIAWFSINTFVFREDNSRAPAKAAQEESVPRIPEVRVFALRSELHAQVFELQGRTEPDRVVTVKSSTSGVVVRAPISEGQFVAQGTLLCGVDVEARQARVAEAEALLRTRELDAQAAQTLTERGWTSANSAAAAQAGVEAAQAAVNTARVELGKTSIRAPFDGVFETRNAELGDFLTPGAPCGVLVDLNPLVISVQVTEQNIRHLAVGMPVEAQMESGEKVAGTLRFVGQVADPVTRTLKVEAAIDASETAVIAGVSVRLRIPIGSVEAMRLPSSMLSLSESGDIGVRHVENNEIVISYVRVIDERDGDVWVTGLPAQANVLSAGQDFIATGTIVTMREVN